MARIFGLLLLGVLIIQTFGVKQQKQQQQQKQAVPVPVQAPPPVVQQVPLRICECDELNRCYQDRLTKDSSLETACRQHCGERIFLNPTYQKVAHCYDDFEKASSDAEARTRQCLGEMGSRQCISTHAHTQPQTVTINATEFLNTKTKHQNRKLVLPDSIDTLNTCIRTCTKNNGIVQFNLDGTPVKATKAPKNNGNGEKNQKNGNEALCAVQLGCQLAPLDKKLDKQAKQLCRFQPGPQEDHDMKLCTCLENALGQNLHCVDQLSPPASCSTPTSQCTENRQAGRN